MSWAERAGLVGNRQRKKTGELLGIAEQMHSFVVDAANAGAKAGGLVPHANQIKIGLVHALRSIGMPASRPVTDLRRGAFHERCTSGRSTVSTITAFWNGRSWPFWSKRTFSDCTAAGLWPGSSGPA